MFVYNVAVPLFGWCCAASTASSLKMNRNLRELHLAENKLTPFDALQLGILLTGNSSLQHVDLRYKNRIYKSTNEKKKLITTFVFVFLI